MNLQISLILTTLVFTGIQGMSATPHLSPKAKIRHESSHSKFLSTDGKMIAVVVPTGCKNDESRIQIFTKTGASVMTKDFGSKDGEHGKCFCKGAWTSDSKFFVWSMESSGGHQPWHFPTYFFDRNQKVVKSVDAKVGGVTTSDFKLKAPDIIEATRLRNKDDHDPFKLSLSHLNG